jgi:hypothetical protein
MGCGRIWFHNDSEMTTRTECVTAHICPSCGNTGWWTRLPDPIGMQVTEVAA